MPVATRPYLPIDLPYHTNHATPETNRGLEFVANVGVVPSPIRKPFTQWVSNIFPWVKGSDVAPDAIVPRFGYSRNLYSPSFHRKAATDSPPIQRAVFSQVVRNSGTKRVRGASVPWPFATPNYPPLLPRGN
jgi:hypothetical protein